MVNRNNNFDDLTQVGGGYQGYDDSYFTGADDLLAMMQPEDDSPIRRLKGLVLSIDWEITDDVLLSLSDELESLKEIWTGEKIHLVYVQALEKLTKYIYVQKARAHPSAVKLLITLYQNLENIVTKKEWSNAQRKEVLLQDVKRFEDLKQHIGADVAAAASTQMKREKPKPVQSAPSAPSSVAEIPSIPPSTASEPQIEPSIEMPVSAEPMAAPSLTEDAVAGGAVAAGVAAGAALGETEQKIDFGSSDTGADEAGMLKELQAAILGLDWEYDDKYIAAIEAEVAALQGRFAGNETRCSLLRGLGEIGSYVRKWKSRAHADTFQVMHALFNTLEKSVITSMSKDDEAALALPVLERYRSLRDAMDETVYPTPVAPIATDIAAAPAAKAATVESVVQEKAPAPIEQDAAADISNEQIDGQVDSMLDALAGDAADHSGGFTGLDASVALQGVDVETEDDDDSDEEALPTDGTGVAPALAALDEDLSAEKSASVESDDDVAGVVSGFFGDDSDTAGGFSLREESVGTDSAAALAGIDVEEDDDEEDAAVQTAPTADIAGVGGNVTASVEPSVDPLAGVDVEEDDDEEDAAVQTAPIADIAGVGGNVTASVEPSVDPLAGVDVEEDDDEEAITEEDLFAGGTAFPDVSSDAVAGVDPSLALAGVDVESEADDDSDEEALPMDGTGVAPALSDFGDMGGALGDAEEGSLAVTGNEGEGSIAGAVSGFFDDDETEESAVPEKEADKGGLGAVAAGIAGAAAAGAAGIAGDVLSGLGDGSEKAESEESVDTSSLDALLSDAPTTLQIDKSAALAGVDVESDADDDSGEAALPTGEDGGAAPALAAFGDDLDNELSGGLAAQGAGDEGISDAVSGFFGDEPEKTEENITEAVKPTDDIANLSASFTDPLSVLSEDGVEETDDATESITAVFDDDVVSVESVLETPVETPASESGEEEIAVPMLDTEESTDISAIDSSLALQGVDVETEADDDSGEEPLLTDDSGAVAPALAALGGFDDEDAPAVQEADDGIADVVGDFFGGGDDTPADTEADAPEEEDGFAWLADNKEEEEEDRFASGLGLFDDEEEPVAPEVQADASDSDDNSLKGGALAGITAGAAGLAAAGVNSLKEKGGDAAANLTGDLFGEERSDQAPPPQKEIQVQSAQTGDALFTATDDGGELATAQSLSSYCDNFAGGDESVFVDIISNYDTLQPMLSGRPLELIMLQNFHTLVEYCETHRSGRDAKAVSLLCSTAKSLTSLLKERDELEAQKIVLRETTAVLEWQASLII